LDSSVSVSRNAELPGYVIDVNKEAGHGPIMVIDVL
jgi:hypothetical protein